ncbi:F-box protein [Candidatus Paracaedibacter symbiosus]|uniref:F-box protein n=1 Tax=Candidatus Paracaedibacter symbiosus TaxID=244582 RepID=UPI000509C8FC|nr:F-box protein [Candidatus Paracaedibacter symbiosus]
MKILTKILPLFLSAAPMTVLAMGGDDINPSKGNKRPYSSIKVEKEEEKSQEHKRQRTQTQEIIAELDEKEPSKKHKQIDDFENHLDYLKSLTPAFRKFILGDDSATRLEDMEAASKQLKKRYYRDFFAKPTSSNFNITDYLSDELKQEILSYCSKKDLANLMLVSHDVRDAVYSLVPVFQEVIKYGQYNNINEFLDEFYHGNPRANAAAGITQHQSHKSYGFCRNKWLDLAFEAGDLSAVSFIFQNKLFFNPMGKGDKVDKLLKIIEEVYKRQEAGKDFSLDKGIASYLSARIHEGKSKREVLKVVNILETSLPRSIEANLMLSRAFLTGTKARQGKNRIEAISINTEEATKYYKKANEIANTLPNFQRGQAHYEIGLWFLIKQTIITGLYKAISPQDTTALAHINGHWLKAIEAWTEAEKGNLQKAVTHFKETIMKSPLFSWWEPKPSKVSSANPTLLSVTQQYCQYLIQNEYIAFRFLKKLYEKDKKTNDQLKPYHLDIDMALVAARNIKSFLSIRHPKGHAPYQSPEFFEACKYFDLAIRLRLQECDEGMCDERMKDKLINNLNAISKLKLTGENILDDYGHTLKQLGLGEPSTSLNPIE